MAGRTLKVLKSNYDSGYLNSDYDSQMIESAKILPI